MQYVSQRATKLPVLFQSATAHIYDISIPDGFMYTSQKTRRTTCYHFLVQHLTFIDDS